jgi:hypothetical protein
VVGRARRRLGSRFLLPGLFGGFAALADLGSRRVRGYAPPPATAAGLSALAAGFAGLLRVEFVRGPFSVRCAASLRGNLTLSFCVHPREPSSTSWLGLARLLMMLLTVLAFARHDFLPSWGLSSRSPDGNVPQVDRRMFQKMGIRPGGDRQ